MSGGPITPDDVLSPGEVAALGGRVVVLVPGSVLVGRSVELGDGVVLYPGAVLQTDAASSIRVGAGTVVYPGAFVSATRGGRVTIGAGVELGPGGVQVTADGPTAHVDVGDRARLMNGPELVGASVVGAGAQIIGPIRAQSVRLGAGGDHREPDPDLRGGVLKGVGLARGIRVGRGEVVNGLGSFADAPVERQRAYHPDAPVAGG